MLKSNYGVELTPFDFQVFESYVPADHYLRRLKATIDFTIMRPLVADCYSPNHGRGAIDPVFLFKLSLLQFHYDLSDEQVIRQVQVNIAFRFFLDLSSQATLPEPSLLSQFRTRLGEKRFNKAFQEILRQARGKGLVKDRLRDASNRQCLRAFGDSVGGANARAVARLSCGQRQMAQLGKSLFPTNFLSDLRWDEEAEQLRILLPFASWRLCVNTSAATTLTYRPA